MIQVFEILGDFLNVRLYRHLRPILDMDISSRVGSAPVLKYGLQLRQIQICVFRHSGGIVRVHGEG